MESLEILTFKLRDIFLFFPQAKKKLTIPANDEKRKEYGLFDSTKVIEVVLNNGDKYQMILGNANFDNTQVYARVNYPDRAQESSQIFLVSKSFQYAIERDINEWKD